MQESGRFILIDRKSFKNKFDKYLKQAEFQRLKVDIRDLILENVSLAQGHPIINYSKHLCGRATDLTLTCLKEYQANGGFIEGIYIALCCHQLCCFEDYVNKPLVQQWGLTSSEFDQMCKLTSWAVNGKRSHMDEATFEKRREIGLKCKKLIDYGRMKFMKEELKMSHVDRVYYVASEVSLENVLLMGKNCNLCCNL
jgi:tRNA:m4X modification enzyme